MYHAYLGGGNVSELSLASSLTLGLLVCSVATGQVVAQFKHNPSMSACTKETSTHNRTARVCELIAHTRSTTNGVVRPSAHQSTTGPTAPRTVQYVLMTKIGVWPGPCMVNGGGKCTLCRLWLCVNQQGSYRNGCVGGCCDRSRLQSTGVRTDTHGHLASL